MVTVMPGLKTLSESAKKPLESVQEPIKAAVSESENFIFKLRWEPVWQADFYQVYRDGDLMVETAVTEFFDNPTHASGSYIVKAYRHGGIISQSDPVQYTLPKVQISEVPDITAVSRYAGVLLKWSQTQSPYVSVYKIDRRLQGSQDWDDVAAISASCNTENRFFDAVDAGRYTYRVVAVSGTGIQSEPAEVTALVPSQPALPVVDLPLTEPPADIEVVGKVDFTPEGAHFKDGYFDIPFNEKLLVTKGLTLECQLSFDTLDRMQVPLCHGWYSAEGWFVQLLGSRITLCTPAINQASREIDANRWYQIRWVYDGSRAHLFVDDNCVHTTEQPVSMTDCTKHIRVGQYINVAPAYTFEGKMRNLKIYDDVILD
jgi:hypothetical protein